MPCIARLAVSPGSTILTYENGIISSKNRISRRSVGCKTKISITNILKGMYFSSVVLY